MEREAFLERVGQAARAGQTHRVTPVDIGSENGYVGADGELPATLAAEINGIGGQAVVVRDWIQAREAVNSVLKEYAPRTAYCWRHPVLEQLELADLLRAADVATVDYDTLRNLAPDEQRRTIMDADIGITSVDFAVAETGSLVVCSQPGQERVASLLPPAHVAIVHESQIVADLFDVFDSLPNDPDSLPSNLAFITGPSKTGDIELQLTTGVHGPGEWHVIIVEKK